MHKKLFRNNLHPSKPALPARPSAEDVAIKDPSSFILHPSSFRPRLFWLMLGVFALVIVLGVGGMVTFFGIATAGLWSGPPAAAPPALQNGRPSPEAAFSAQEWAGLLAQSYQEEGESWEGVERRLPQPPVWIGYVLVDARGVVVLSNQARFSKGEQINERDLRRGTSIMVRGTQVGTLLATPNSPYAERVMRGLLGAGFGLVAVLLLLAAAFSRRISKPLRRLTYAAEAVAAGDLTVRVRGAPIRELDMLAGSFNRMADSLVAADKQRRQLTADVAHELRTPLTIIKGQLEGIQDGVYAPSPERVAGLLEKTDLLERLIEDLRLLALSEAGQLQLFPESVEVGLLLDDAADSFAAQAHERGVTLDVRVEPALPELQADPQRIGQVLTNLVGNALRYTPAAGTVTLRAQRMKDEDRRIHSDDGEGASLGDTRISSSAIILHPSAFILFEVSDTGQGISPEDLPHIFDRFWRADRSRTRTSGGTGLGLAIARQIVEAHGGRMWAASSVGQGTTVSFSVPIETSAKLVD